MLCDIFDAFGLKFSEYSPEPPPPFNPQLPETEWNAVLQGEEITVHPDDDDQAHIEAHESRLLAMYSGNPEDRDLDAMGKMVTHVETHKQALQQKMQMQELMSGIQGMMQAAQGGIAGAAGQAPGDGGQVDPMSALLAGLQGAAGGQGQPGMPPQGMPPQPGMMG
jgi:hypothetical protein